MYECPECGMAMMREMFGEGPDTYFYVYTCEDCGTEIEWIPNREGMNDND